jgi:hypothetical protein
MKLTLLAANPTTGISASTAMRMRTERPLRACENDRRAVKREKDMASLAHAWPSRQRRRSALVGPMHRPACKREMVNNLGNQRFGRYSA